VEYATREQAQQAVNTLSNQNLMGRLVYVREVNLPAVFSESFVKQGADNGSFKTRTVKLNLALLAHPRESSVAAEVVLAEVSAAAAAAAAALAVVDDRSMFPTFVTLSLFCCLWSKEYCSMLTLGDT
jgi:hypothetical protein